jgi:penicillin-binding protein 1A
VVDEPVTINGWSPRNSSGRNAGEMDIRTAFAYSVNTVAAKIGQEVGFSTVADMARRFGITTPISTVPSMVLGSNDVRLIDMTRAFASVANKGVAVTPYGITKVTSMGETIYNHEVDRSHVLVAPYVAAEMTDLLQTAVATGTGKAAQIGRPVAGKTGTTSSNKDGWFLGFSSGLTTGVWMGRDDAKSIPGLQGGTLPARAFAAFMKVATAGRPVEAFDTQVTLPEWQLDNESDFGQPDNGLFVDPDGNPLPPDQIAPDAPIGGGDAGEPPQTENDPPQTAPDASDDSTRQTDERLDRKWIDRMTGGSGTDPNRPKRVVPNGSAPADRPREVQPPRPTQ